MDRPPSVLSLLKETGREIIADDCMSLSAAIAYSTLFSLPPLLVIVVAVSGPVFGAEAVRQQITEQMSGLIGADGAGQIEEMIRNASEFGGDSVVATLISVLLLLVGATGAFGQLQRALNLAWEVKPDPKGGGIWGYVLKRLLSFGLVLTIAFLLLVSLALSAFLVAFQDVVEQLVGGSGIAVLINVLNFALSFGLVTVLFAAIFRWLPDAEIAWRDVWVGAAVTALLFTIGKTLIGLYLGTADVGSAFGAAGSVIVVLVWIYYSALILLAGAEFTQVWTRHRGVRIRPAEDAVRVIETERIVREGEAPDERAEQEDGSTEQVDRPYVHPRKPAPRSGWNE